MVKSNSKILAVALCAVTLGGLAIVPSASASDILGSSFMVKATNKQENQFFGIRGYKAPGKGDGSGSGSGSTPGGGTGDTPGGSGGSTGGTSPGGGSGGTVGDTGDGSDPSGLPYTGDQGATRANTTAGYWSSMAYGAGKYLAVSYIGDSTLSSTDEGKSWKTDPLPSGNWNGVAFGNGRFVAVAQAESGDPAVGGQIATSTDGVSWTVRRTPGYSYQSVAYANGIFVAVGNDSSQAVIQTSTDGSGWTDRSLPTGFIDSSHEGTMILARVQFVNGQFYAESGLGLDPNDGQYSRSALLIRSTDGKSWSTTKALPGTSAGWTMIGNGITSYSRDKIVKTSSGLIHTALSLDGNGSDFFRSTDGGNSWTKFTPTGLPAMVTPQFASGNTIFAYSPVEDNIQFYSSTDGGYSWNQVVDGYLTSGFGFRNEFASATHGNCTVSIPMASSSAFRYCS